MTRQSPDRACAERLRNHALAVVDDPRMSAHAQHCAELVAQQAEQEIREPSDVRAS